MFLLLELLVLMLSVRLIALKILIPMHYWPVAMNDMQSSSIWQMEDQGNKCLKVVYIIYLKCTSFLKVIMEKDREDIDESKSEEHVGDIDEGNIGSLDEHMCAVPLANHLRAVADAFRRLKTHQRY